MRSVRLLPLPALLAGLLLSSACAQPPAASAAPRPAAAAVAPLEVETLEVRAEALPRWLPLTGTLVPGEDAQVAAGANGKVLATDVERGQRVKKGEPMVKLDGRIASAQLQAAAAQVKVAEAQAQAAQADCERSNQLFKGGGVAISQHQRTLAACATADAQLAAARAQHSLALSNASDMTIRAPFDGVVAERMVSPGEFVSAASPVVTLLSTDKLRLELTVPAASAQEVRVGQTVEFSARGFMPGAPNQSAKVTFVGAALRKGSRDLVVEALVDAGTAELVPGSFVNARLRLDDAPLPVVPRSAVREDNGQARVFVVRDGRLLERLVQLGEGRDGLAGILNGVSAGERVVATASSELRDGAAVK